MEIKGLRAWMLVAVLLIGHSPAAAQVRLTREAEEEAANPSRSAIYLEDSPAVQEMVAEAARLRRDGRLGDAVSVYQQIIEQYPQKLMTRGNGRYFDAVVWVHQELLADAQLLQTYRRMHEAAGRHLLAQAASEADEAEALQRVMQRYLLCDSGLEAGLRLAGLYLSLGNIVDARGVLTDLAEHPDLSKQAARFHHLKASAALFEGEKATYETHRDALEALGRQDEATQLRRWAGRMRRPQTGAAASGLDRGAAEPAPASLGRPLWTLASPPILRGDTVEPNIRGRAIRTGSRPTYPMVPTVDGETLYINNAREVLAVDRISRRTLWQYDWENQHATASTIQQFRRSGMGLSDRRGVLVSQGRVYAVLGLASDMMGMWHRQNLATNLVCLDARDGSVIWQVEPGDLDRSLERGFFHGTPLAGPDRIYALVRRSQTGFYESFLVALDARSGIPLWRRHLASTSAAVRNDQFPFAQMTLEGGDLYIVDHLGTISCIDGRSGAVRWLTVLGDETTTTERAIAQATHVRNAGFESPPLLVSAGLVVASYSDSRIVLLDPRTGELKRDLSDTVLGRSLYMLRSGEDVLAVGRNVQLLAGDTLEVRWSRAMEGVSSTTAIGWPALTARHAWIPAVDRVLVLDLATGEGRLTETVNEVGNALVAGPQLLIAGQETIYSYMQWEVARDNLRDQIAELPLDPQPGLALAELALTTDQHEAVVEGVDHALAALRRRSNERQQPLAADPLQARAFEQVRSMIDPTRTPDAVLRERLFERWAALAAGPGDEVQYLMALGALKLETQRPEQAAEHYQTILKNPTLASQAYRHGVVAQQAGQEARYRLQAVVDAHPQAYTPFENEAAARLAELLATPRHDAEALKELARQYPLSRSAAPALLAAARQHLERETIGEAIALLRRAYVYAQDQSVVEEVAGELVYVYESLDQPRQAVQWLRKALRDYPQLRPVRDGEAVDAQSWLSRLLDHPDGPERLATLPWPLGEPRVLSGRMLLPTRQGREAWPLDAFITYHEHRLHYHAGRDLEVKWQWPARNGQVELLALTDDRAVLWYRAESKLVAIDVQSGAEAWPAINIAATLEQIAVDPNEERRTEALRQRAADGVLIFDGGDHVLINDRVQQAQIRVRVAAGEQAQVAREVRIVPHGGGAEFLAQGGADFDRDLRRQLATRSLIALNDSLICVADPMGRVTGIDRLTGQVLWIARGSFDALGFLEMNDDFVVLSGPMGLGGEAVRGGIMVLDAMTGQVRQARLELPQPANWLGVSPSGIVIAGSGGELYAFSAAQGDLQWRQPITRHVEKGAIDLDRILLVDGGRSLLVIDPVTGRREATLAVSDARFSHHPEWRQAQGVHHILTGEQALALGEAGSVLWRDAIFDDPKNLQAQLLSEKYVLLIGVDSMPALAVEQAAGRRRFEVFAEQRHSYRLYLLDRTSGRLLRQQQLGPIAEPLDPQATLLLNHHVIFGTAGGRVLVLGGGE